MYGHNSSYHYCIFLIRPLSFQLRSSQWNLVIYNVLELKFLQSWLHQERKMSSNDSICMANKPCFIDFSSSHMPNFFGSRSTCKSHHSRLESCEIWSRKHYRESFKNGSNIAEMFQKTNLQSFPSRVIIEGTPVLLHVLHQYLHLCRQLQCLSHLYEGNPRFKVSSILETIRRGFIQPALPLEFIED